MAASHAGEVIQKGRWKGTYKRALWIGSQNEKHPFDSFSIKKYHIKENALRFFENKAADSMSPNVINQSSTCKQALQLYA